jgi:hypothetical protein
MVRGQPAREVRLLAPAEGVVEMMLNGELAEIRDFGVIELNLVDSAGWTRMQRQGSESSEHQ